MNEGVLMVVDCVFMGGEAEVAFFEEEDLVVLSQQHPHSDVEFLLVYQHRTFDVFLDHET